MDKCKICGYIFKTKEINIITGQITKQDICGVCEENQKLMNEDKKKRG